MDRVSSVNCLSFTINNVKLYYTQELTNDRKGRMTQNKYFTTVKKKTVRNSFINRKLHRRVTPNIEKYWKPFRCRVSGKVTRIIGGTEVPPLQSPLHLQTSKLHSVPQS